MSWHYHPDEEFYKDEGYLTVAHYMMYWKIDPTLRDEIARHYTTAYAASNQLKKVKPGDVLWIVNVSQHQLYLLGRLRVEFVVDDTAIAQELVDPQPEHWLDADWYAISNKYHIEPMRAINITHTAEELRFKSASDRLDVVEGRVDANQLTNLRQLMPTAAGLLDDIWYNEAYTPQNVQDFLEFSEDDIAYAEGKTVVRTVKQRTRSRKLVAEAKAKFRTLHEGRLFCQICGFDFTQAYGVEYIEAHHTEPIASLETETTNTAEAVVLLCANCHRAAHTRTPPYSVDELRAMIEMREE